MSKLVRGDKLPNKLQRQVLNMYVRRWTHENAQQTFHGQCPACAQVKFPYTAGQALPEGPTTYTREQWHTYHAPVVTDAEWLKKHAFYTKSGELDKRQAHAEPGYLAEE